MGKKLLFIITKSEMGGAQRFLYELVTHLSSEKHEITVASGGHGELFEKLRRFAFANIGAQTVASGLTETGIKTIKIRNFSNVPGIKNVLAFFEIFSIIRNEKPDTVYLLSSEAGFSGSIAAFIYRCGRKKPKIIYRIGGWAFKELKNILIKKIYLLAEKLSAPFKDVIIVNSEFDRQIAIKNNIAKPDKIKVIYNGVNIEELKFLPKEQAIKFIESKILNTKYKIQNTILIGTIANLYKNKGLEFLISAAKIIKEKNLDWQFVIIGEGQERQNLEKAIKKYGLENFAYLVGAMPDAYKYLKAFDLFILPSVKEGQPWTILEAMVAGVPIVATNIAGIPEMIENEKSGLLVEPADSEALVAAIEKMLTHPSLAHECAGKAFAVVKEKFKIEEMLRKNEELF